MAVTRPKLVVQTRSPDVTRDIDLFQQIEANGGRVQVNMTVTTDNENVRKTIRAILPGKSASALTPSSRSTRRACKPVSH